MDNLFRTRVLTRAVNRMRTPGMVIYDRLFRGREHLEASDRLAFDVISGSEEVLQSISVSAPATVTEKTSRKTITLQAPRLAQKRIIHTHELNALRGYGQQFAVEQMQTRIARELMDMRAMHDRTLEYWAASALKGVIHDADGGELVNFSLDGTHTPTETGDDLWTSAGSNPLGRIREYQRLVEDDSGAPITGWVAFLGSDVMDALLDHDDVLDLLKYSLGQSIAQTGRITNLADVELVEYNGSYLDPDGQRQRFIASDHFLLAGLCQDLVDCPYAPVVDSDAEGGVGNSGLGEMFFSKSWDEKDPSGRWIKTEARPLPVLQRPDCVVYAKVV